MFGSRASLHRYSRWSDVPESDWVVAYFSALVVGPSVAQHTGDLKPVLSMGFDRSCEGDVLGRGPSACNQ